MGKGPRFMQPTNDRLLLLKKYQESYTEGSSKWIELQGKINQIIAENYLRYVNR